MSPKQLMLSAIKRQPVDRVPVATYNFHPFGAFSQEPAYRPMLEAVRRAENVGMLCKASVTRMGGMRNRMEAESQSRGDTTLRIIRLDTPKGKLEMVYRKPKDQPGYYVEALIKDDKDIAKFLSLPVEPAIVDLSPTLELYDKLGEKGLAYVSYEDPFYSVAQWFDFEDFAVRCLQELPLMQELIDREFGRIKVELEMTLNQAKGYDLLFYTVGPEVATPPMMAPAIFAKLITPYEKELVGMIKEAGHLSSIHCHGKVREVFDQFRHIGADVLEPMEPPPQGDISLEEALERTEGCICLMGYIQDQHLYTSKKGEMQEKVLLILRQVSSRSGYIMTPTATPYMFPPPTDFVRNYVEFIHTANGAC